MCFSGGTADKVKGFAKKTDPIVYKGVSTAVKYSKKYDYVRSLKKGKERKEEKRAATWDAYNAAQSQGVSTDKSSSQNLISKGIREKERKRKQRLLVNNYDPDVNSKTILGG